MKCPMSANQYGTMSLCSETRCAWWDTAAKQCCIKTFMTSKRTEEKIKEEQRDSFIESIVKMELV